MDDNNEKDSLAVEAYRKFRKSEATKVKYDTTDAGQLYRRYGPDSELSESRRDRNIEAIIDAVEQDAKKRRVVTEILQQIESTESGQERTVNPTRQPSLGKKSSSGLSWFKAPLNLLTRVGDLAATGTAQLAIPAAAVCLLTFGLLAFFNTDRTIPANQTIASVPEALVDERLSNSIAASVGSKTQLGLTDSSSVYETLFQLGATTTQLEVSSALGEDVLVENTVTMLDLLSGAVESEQVAVNVQLLIEEAGIARSVPDTGLATVLGRLHQSLLDTDPSSQSFRWYRLGQLMESLRLALALASEEGNDAALVEVRGMLNDFDLQSVDTQSAPKLGDVLGKIAAKVGGGEVLGVADYRTLTSYTEQVFVLLR